MDKERKKKHDLLSKTEIFFLMIEESVKENEGVSFTKEEIKDVLHQIDHLIDDYFRS